MGASPPQDFVQALRDLGYVEGQNIAFAYTKSVSNRDRTSELAAELVQLKVDIIVAGSTSSSLAAKKASSTIPIVVMTSIDPVANGLVASLARPGGNATGINHWEKRACSWESWP